jgi:hypothetical protein
VCVDTYSIHVFMHRSVQSFNWCNLLYLLRSWNLQCFWCFWMHIVCGKCVKHRLSLKPYCVLLLLHVCFGRQLFFFISHHVLNRFSILCFSLSITPPSVPSYFWKAGYYVSTTGATSCSPCASGKISALGASSCTSCSAGYYSPGSASTSCSTCPTGTYSAAGASSCTSCSAGKYAALSASSTCTNCAAGKYSSTRASGCVSCTKGQFASSEGSTSCSNCTAGTYSSLSTATLCTACPGGRYSYRTGMSHCEICLAGTYSTGGNASCHACPDGSTSSNEASSCDELCTAGTYISGTSCVDCPVGKYSNAGDTACTNCPVGYYAPSVKTAVVCTICPAGYLYITTPIVSMLMLCCVLKNKNKLSLCYFISSYSKLTPHHHHPHPRTHLSRILCWYYWLEYSDNMSCW